MVVFSTGFNANTHSSRKPVDEIRNLISAAWCGTAWIILCLTITVLAYYMLRYPLQFAPAVPEGAHFYDVSTSSDNRAILCLCKSFPMSCEALYHQNIPICCWYSTNCVMNIYILYIAWLFMPVQCHLQVTTHGQCVCVSLKHICFRTGFAVQPDLCWRNYFPSLSVIVG